MSRWGNNVAQSISCCDCQGEVRLLHARVLEWHRLGLAHVEFEVICLDCGRWDAVTRVMEDLPENERAFCRREQVRNDSSSGKISP